MGNEAITGSDLKAEVPEVRDRVNMRIEMRRNVSDSAEQQDSGMGA